MLDAALLALGWIGTGLAVLFAASLAVRRNEADRWLAAGLGVAAAASGLINVSHAGFSAPALESSEVVVTLAAGPLAASWFAYVADLRIMSRARTLAFLPAVLWTGISLAGSALAADRRAIRWAVIFQIGWSLAVALLVIVRWPLLGALRRRQLSGALAGIGILHLTQLSRLMAPRAVPENLVPATLGVLLGGLGFAVLRSARLPFAVGPGEVEGAGQLLARLDGWLVDDRAAFAEQRLSLSRAARRLGVTPARLSRAVNGHVGETFSEHVAAVRVQEAERLLADPRLEHLSVEAIGVRAGFGSRSSFFSEFRRRSDCTPAEYRSRALSKRA